MNSVNSIRFKILCLWNLKALISKNNPTTEPDKINDNLNCAAPNKNVPIRNKFFWLNFFSFTNKYNATVVKSWGKSKGFGPEIKNNITGELITKNNHIYFFTLFFSTWTSISWVLASSMCSRRWGNQFVCFFKPFIWLQVSFKK